MPHLLQGFFWGGGTSRFSHSLTQDCRADRLNIEAFASSTTKSQLLPQAPIMGSLLQAKWRYWWVSFFACIYLVAVKSSQTASLLSSGGLLQLATLQFPLVNISSLDFEQSVSHFAILNVFNSLIPY